MKMQNVEMEFVTFDAQDVIATSGPIPGVPNTLKISGYYDGTKNNFAVDFDNNTYTDATSIQNALKGYGYTGISFDTFNYENTGLGDGQDTIGNTFRNEDPSDNDSSSPYKAGNGYYTWDGSLLMWIRDLIQPQ